MAKERIGQLIESARAAVGQIQPQLESNSTALFQATWNASRAAGFLEAFALIDPELAGEMLADFESVAGMVDQLRATGQAGNHNETPDGPGAQHGLDGQHGVGGQHSLGGIDGREDDRPTPDQLVDGRLLVRTEGDIRRITVRRLLSDRRTSARRQLDDRRGL